MNALTVDLYGVGTRRHELLATAKSPHFSRWWPQFLAAQERELGQPAWPEIPGIGGMTPEAALGAQHARLLNQSARLEALACAYALTGEGRYGEGSQRILHALAADGTPWMDPVVHKAIYPELNADLGYGTLCYRVAAALGWLVPLLAAAEQRRLLALLAERAAVIHEDALRGAWWGDAPNSNWTSHLMHGLGAAALALLPSQPGLARPWVDLVTDRMLRMLDLAREEGAGIEGIGYFFGCYANIAYYATELRSVTGENLFAHEFWGKCALFPLYHTLPDLSGRTPVGDSHYPGLSGSVLLAVVARETRDGIAQWQAHRAYERTTPGLYDLLFYDPTVPEVSPETLPPCRVFPSVQTASFRSGWDRDAVYAYFHGGSNSWSHCHLDLNMFTLDAFGERLAIDHGSWAYSPHYFRVTEPQISTAWHNTVCVDGADQRQVPRFRMSYDAREGGDCYSVLEQYLGCAAIQMLRGDATTAYADTLDRCWREFVFLPPDRVIVYDNLVTNGARVQRHLQWLLHSEHPMADCDGHVEVRGKKATLVVQPVFPDGVRYRFPDRVARAHAHPNKPLKECHAVSLYPPWTHIWNESPSKPPYPQWDPRGGVRVYGPDYQFLVVLTPIRAGGAVDWRTERLAADGVDGVTLVAGDRIDTVLFRRSGGEFRAGNVTANADKVVVREQDGRVAAFAAWNATRVEYRGQVLLDEAVPVNRAETLE